MAFAPLPVFPKSPLSVVGETHLSTMLQDKDPYVRQQAIGHPKATAEHITQAITDKDPSVRWQAISHSKATAEHITQALKDKNSGVRRQAIRHPNFTEHHTPLPEDEDFACEILIKRKMGIFDCGDHDLIPF